jgi:hypothetical protein
MSRYCSGRRGAPRVSSAVAALARAVDRSQGKAGGE